jgi:hypothetical protein
MQRTCRLRIVLDLKYPRVIDDARELLERCFPLNLVHVGLKNSKGRCATVSVYSSHLPCLLPQHGAGKKHERPIALEAWQQEHVNVAPWAFLRGCIRSDGCVFVNRTGPYRYISYDFANRSKDIADLFVATCRLLELDCRPTEYRGKWSVRINRQASVIRMLQYVGVKA